MSLTSTLVVIATVGSLGAFLFGHKSVQTEVVIEASSEAVWQVLTDLEKYKEWNPVFEYKEGQLKKGSKVVYKVTEAENKSAVMTAKVEKLVPNKLLNQTGGLLGIITFNHTYTLTEVAQGTKVTIHEEYRGIYVNFWSEKLIAQQYKKLAQALKTRANEIQ